MIISSSLKNGKTVYQSDGKLPYQADGKLPYRRDGKTTCYLHVPNPLITNQVLCIY